MYEKLFRAEIYDEEDSKKYCVNFFRKGVEQNEPLISRDQHISPQDFKIRMVMTMMFTVATNKSCRSWPNNF